MENGQPGPENLARIFGKRCRVCSPSPYGRRRLGPATGFSGQAQSDNGRLWASSSLIWREVERLVFIGLVVRHNQLSSLELANRMELAREWGAL